MPVTRRPRGPLLAAPVAALALALLLPLARREGRPPGGGDAIGREVRRGRELDALVRRMHRREMAKARLVLAVSQGRMGLLEAAAGCLALNRQQPPVDWERFRAAQPGASDEERHCRRVIDVAAATLSEEDPCHAEAFRDRLERELERHLRRGPLSLPEPAVLPEG